MKKILNYALSNAFGTAVYVSLVATFLYFAGQFNQPDKTILIPTAMLMLLVLSVAIVGSLLFGRPLIWYLDGKKKDAIKLLLWTLGTFLILTILLLFVAVGIF